MRVSIAEARSGFSALLKRAQEELVIVTRRGEPDAVILPFEEYERPRRLRAYLSMVRLFRELKGIGVRHWGKSRTIAPSPRPRGRSGRR